MNNETQVQIQNKFCLTIDEAVIYFNIGEKKLRNLFQIIWTPVLLFKWSEVSYQKETI